MRAGVVPVKRVVTPPASWPPTLIVIVDTEEEFDWSAPFDPACTSVSNIDLQLDAQRIFDRCGLVPTYVVDYPVATTSSSVDVLAAIAQAGRCEIGAHLHPWVNPPFEGPIDTRHSYPGNLAPDLERRKLASLTQAIVANFGQSPIVYKAGRYGLGPATAESLRFLGYRIDCSVVPHTDFSADGGPDYAAYGSTPFEVADGLVELPLSVNLVGHLAGCGPKLFRYLAGPMARRLRLAGLWAHLGLLERLRLTPEGHTVSDMVRQTRAALEAGSKLFMLTYHSSSLKPGATAYARNESERDQFLARLEGYIAFFLREVGGRTDTAARVAASLCPARAASPGPSAGGPLTVEGGPVRAMGGLA